MGEIWGLGIGIGWGDLGLEIGMLRGRWWGLGSLQGGAPARALDFFWKKEI